MNTTRRSAHTRARLARAAAAFAPALALAAALAAGGCESDAGAGGGGCGTDGTGCATTWVGQLAQTLRLGASDNAEVIKVVPGRPLALLVSSKARKVTLLRVTGDRMETVREATLFADDPTESELTHVDVSSDGSWAVLTRTLLTTDGSGAQTACGGELVFIDAADADTFGAVTRQVTVGPMPDSVDISDDDTLVVSANERDGPDAWGKCEVAGATPSISVVDVAGGPAAATERHRIELVDADTGPREPESVVFSADNDLVVATLQDSHEVALFRVSALAGKTAPTSDDLTIVRLPDDALGAGPWPDGVARVQAGDGTEYFVVAGEWNDTLTVLDGTGRVVATKTVAASDLPANLPRVLQEGYPPFSPDSLAPFRAGDRVYLAVTLRHAGAVAVYDLTDPAAPAYHTAVAVGADERGGQDEDGSTIRPEGISAASDGAFVVVANEGESSVSLVVPVP
jgi:DNA-binding beta-propeller fold protein YncE